MIIHHPKPILKWAGGKTQLVKKISQIFPYEFGNRINRYAEPFVGGGALLFYILSRYNLKEVYISDINAELMNMYLMVRDHLEEVISLLSKYEATYIPLMDFDRRKYYYEKRLEFNDLILNGTSMAGPQSAALFIFLNRTCFNGLYRANKQGQFNVPTGVYKNPAICNTNNLYEVSAALANVQIVCGDYKESNSFINDKTLVYFDPPYRPLKDRESFNSYTKAPFDDACQKELAEFIKTLNNKHSYIILSNSDPTNTDPADTFFTDLYSDFFIQKIDAKRLINRNVGSRGSIHELLICNYHVPEQPLII